jgi:hypothetical protein
MRVTHRRRRFFVLAAAVAPLFAAGSAAHAGGTFDGGQVAATRDWINPLNWDLDVLPGPADPIVFTDCGDGAVDLNGGFYSSRR